MRRFALLLAPLCCAPAAEPLRWPAQERALPARERLLPAAPAEPRLRFDRYHAGEEMERAFSALERRHPRWFRAGSLGRSVEGRSLPLLAIGDFESESLSRAFWIDGAIHGGELESAEVVLRVAEEMRSRIAAGEPPEFLSTVALYLAPLLNPDGRARALSVPPEHGRLNSAADGGVDLNRDFPARWTADKARAVDAAQPETASVMRFWRAHPEIELAASFHTSVRAFLAPPLPLSRAARARYDEIAALYEARLGTPRVDVPTHARGTTMDWFFAARGAIAFTLEIQGAHRPDAPLKERSPRRIDAFLASELEPLVRGHAELLIDLAASMAQRAPVAR